MSSRGVSIESLVNDHPLFRLAIPFKCGCGKKYSIQEHEIGREESRVFVTVSNACPCGEAPPRLSMHLTRLQRRRWEDSANEEQSPRLS